MLKFLEEILGHSDDIIYGAGTELYNRMAQDTQDRHSKFAVWGDQLQKDLHDRKKSLQLEESNYNKAINRLKTIPTEELEKDLLLKNIDIDTYLAPLSSQLGTGMFLGDRNEILNRIMHFLKEAPIKIGTPYVASENYFEQNFDNLDKKMQSVSGMGYNTWRSLTKKGELSMLEGTEPVKFKEEDKLRSDIEVSSLSAKAFGILNTYPGTIEGNNNLQFMQTNLIVANAHTQFSNDIDARADFINKKLFENNIDPMIALNYSNPVSFKQMSQVIDQYGKVQATKIAELVNQLKGAETNEAKQKIQEDINRLLLDQHQLMDEYSKTVPRILAGEDQSAIMGTATTDKEEVIVPQVAENYLPRLDNKGDLIIKYDNGETQNLSLEMLINNPDNLKGIPKVAQDYVLKIQDSLFEDGQMIEPTREMFKKGAAGDKAFKDFLEIYFGFNPDIGLTGHTGKGGVELHHSFSDWFKNIYEGTKTLGAAKSGTKRGPGESKVKQYADITQFVTNEVASSLNTDALTAETDKIKIEELKSGNVPILDENKQSILEDQTGSQIKTRFSGKKGNSIKTILEDSNIQKDKQESLLKKLQAAFGTSNLEKLKEDFPDASVAMGSGSIEFPDINIKANKNVDTIYKYLNKRLSSEASAALLGNISVESPAFDFKQVEKTDKPNKGYGLFQFTNNKKGQGHMAEYSKYLKNNNKEDSIQSQIDYVLDNIYKGIGYDIGAGNRKKLQTIFKTGTVEEIPKAFHDIFEIPQEGSLDTRTKFALDLYNSYKP